MIPWIGEYPWFFPYFIHSCKYNLSIDFIILSDNQTYISESIPNVKIIPYSIKQFKTDVSKALSFDVVIDYGCKLCDFKPAYGYI